MQEKIDLNQLIDLSETISRELKIGAKASLHVGKTKPTDFNILKKLAKGGYGEVYVVERNGKVYAMKKVSKQLVMRNTNTTFFLNEREIMTSHNADWLVKSSMCLQDDTYLYYIMEFVHGGDLLGYLSKKDILSEEEIRFYAAEIIIAVNEMHKNGWIHRDLKPDNILIDRHGHVKLGDFGSCAKLENGYVISNTTVGTPDYISPDVLNSTGDTVAYGPEIDYWSVGVILYEMFYGVTPFYSSSLSQTYSKITDIAFEFEEGISDDFRDLISNLVCRKEDRFGFEQIKQHRFFDKIDWDNLRSHTPPFRPQVSSDEDISNFVDTDFNPDKTTTAHGFMNFIGFTYDPDHVKQIADSVMRDYGDKMLGNPAESAEVCIATNDTELEAKRRDLECTRNAVAELTEKLGELRCNNEELSSQTMALNQNLQQTLDQIAVKKDQLEEINNELKSAKDELHQIKLDIVSKSASLADKKTTHGIIEDIADIRKQIERAKLPERLQTIKETAYWFYKQYQAQVQEIKILSQTEGENKSYEDLKKQVRMHKNEIREYEQKIENEIIQRKKLEEEIKGLRRSLKEASKSFSNFVLSAANAMNNKEIQLSIENGVMRIDSEEYMINTIFVRELKNNEMHHLPYKKRALCLQMFLLNEPVRCSSSSGSRRTVKALEADLEKEEKILRGLESLLNVLEGKSREEAVMQIRGSNKKIEELRSEIERAKKSTIADCQIDDNERVYEFNSHLFYEKTVAKGTLCDHCNEILYGLVNQAYCCRDCLLVVHKSCYVLVDVSCELNRAIKAGKSIPIICKTIEDKQKLLNLNKVI